MENENSDLIEQSMSDPSNAIVTERNHLTDKPEIEEPSLSGHSDDNIESATNNEEIKEPQV